MPGVQLERSCQRCSGALRPGSVFCPHCGALASPSESGQAADPAFPVTPPPPPGAHAVAPRSRGAMVVGLLLGVIVGALGAQKMGLEPVVGGIIGGICGALGG